MHAHARACTLLALMHACSFGVFIPVSTFVRLSFCLRNGDGVIFWHDFQQTWHTPDLMMEPCPSPHGLTNSTLQSNNDPGIPQILRVAHTPKQRSRCKLAPTASPCRGFSRESIERICANPDISKSANYIFGEVVNRRTQFNQKKIKVLTSFPICN